MSARIPSLKRELEDNVAEDITNDNEAKPPASDIENADNIVIDVPNNLKARTDFILQQRRDVIQKLCQQSRNGAPNISVEPARTLVQKLTAFMRWLENSVEMTPELRSKTQIDKGLFIMYQKPGLGDRFTLPDRFSAWAERLVGKCKEQKWGAGEVVDEEEEEEEDIVPGRRASASAHKRTASTPAVIATTLRPPPSGHPMFGEKGIMHGVVMKIAKVRTWVLDSRYPKKDAKVYGHNGIPVGTWYPFQVVALFNGAHGSKMGAFLATKNMAPIPSSCRECTMTWITTSETLSSTPGLTLMTTPILRPHSRLALLHKPCTLP